MPHAVARLVSPNCGSSVATHASSPVSTETVREGLDGTWIERWGLMAMLLVWRRRAGMPCCLAQVDARVSASEIWKLAILRRFLPCRVHCFCAKLLAPEWSFALNVTLP